MLKLLVTVALAFAFNVVGLPAIFDPTLTYEFTYDSTGMSGEVYVEAEGPGVPVAQDRAHPPAKPSAPGTKSWSESTAHVA